MNDVKRKMLEAVLVQYSKSRENFDSWLLSQAMTPQQASEYLHECKTDGDRREYLEFLLKQEPSALDVAQSIMNDMLPNVSEEFRRDAAKAMIDRYQRLGFQIIAPEQTQFEIKRNQEDVDKVLDILEGKQ